MLPLSLFRSGQLNAANIVTFAVYGWQTASARSVAVRLRQPLCGSTPIITAAISMLQVLGNNAERGGHA